MREDATCDGPDAQKTNEWPIDGDRVRVRDIEADRDLLARVLCVETPRPPPRSRRRDRRAAAEPAYRQRLPAPRRAGRGHACSPFAQTADGARLDADNGDRLAVAA